MKKILMARGADKVVSTCVKVKPGEKVLIITEASRLSIAEAIAAAVYRVQAEPILQVMVPRDTDGQEPPAPVAAAMKASDAFISVVGRSITHTHAVKDAIAGGSRGVVLTQFTEDMMIQPLSFGPATARRTRLRRAWLQPDYTIAGGWRQAETKF